MDNIPITRFPQKKRAGFLKTTVLDVAWHFSNVLGTALFSKLPPPGPRYLNLGCGAITYEGFINADCFNLLALFKGLHRKPDWLLDATRTWRCADSYWEGVFCEHVIEHMTYSEAISCLMEVHRTLRALGRLRIIVPDIDIYIAMSGDEVTKRFASRPEAIASVTQDWGHRSVWNADLLREMLEVIGFVDVRVQRFGEGMVPDLIKDTSERAWESCYVEALKV